LRLDEAFDSPERKREYVRRLFATIADRYDLITGLLSYGQDRRWKARLVREARVSASDVVLDLACGTGDIALAIAALGPQRVIGLDITFRMLEIATRKSVQVSWMAGDMTALPLGDATADLVTTGYGLRNLPDLDAGLSEIARVLRPGGRFVSLDFNRPDSPFVRGPYLTYLTAVGSILGWALHGDPDCYRYIPASIMRYPGARDVAARLRRLGFHDVRVTPLLGGLMSLHVARRSHLRHARPSEAEPR
jgi:demethylmenaquinone methyltransferase/2-methoxy-6-polyprenyl-1,4-benzoquinol methylase